MKRRIERDRKKGHNQSSPQLSIYFILGFIA